MIVMKTTVVMMEDSNQEDKDEISNKPLDQTNSNHPTQTMHMTFKPLRISRHLAMRGINPTILFNYRLTLMIAQW